MHCALMPGIEMSWHTTPGEFEVKYRVSSKPKLSRKGWYFVWKKETHPGREESLCTEKPQCQSPPNDSQVNECRGRVPLLLLSVVSLLIIWLVGTQLWEPEFKPRIGQIDPPYKQTRCGGRLCNPRAGATETVNPWGCLAGQLSLLC